MPQITINLLPKIEYPINIMKREGIEVGSSLGHNLSVRHGDKVSNSCPKVVNGLGPCVGVAIIGSKDKFVAHSAPEIDIKYNVVEFITKKINEIREKSKSDDVSTVIYGGIAYNGENPLSEDSCALVDKFEEACLSEGVEPTIITGQYSDGLKTRLNSYIGNKQMTLWSDLFNGVNLGTKASKEEVVKTLEKLFEYVKVPEQTALKVLEQLPHKTNHLTK